MIILGCIEFHLNGCTWWIIVMRLRVLLIMHHLIQWILVEEVLDVHVRAVKIKSFLIHMLLWCIFYKKKNSWKNYLCWFAHGEPYVPYKNMVEK